MNIPHGNFDGINRIPGKFLGVGIKGMLNIPRNFLELGLNTLNTEKFLGLPKTFLGWNGISEKFLGWNGIPEKFLGWNGISGEIIHMYIYISISLNYISYI